jgi:hypothetical protein
VPANGQPPSAGQESEAITEGMVPGLIEHSDDHHDHN